MSTPVKTPRHSRSRSSDTNRFSENLQPNVPISTPSKKSAMSPASRSVPRAKKPVPFSPLPPPPRVRKFVVAKNKTTANDFDAKKRQEAAYEKLRASQEEFFKKDMAPMVNTEVSIQDDGKDVQDKGIDNLNRDRCSNERKNRHMVMEEAMNSIPEPGSGRVKHLVKAFESILSISEDEESGRKERKPLLMDWLLPSLLPKISESNGCPPSPPASLDLFPFGGRDSRLCSSLEGLDSKLSLGSRSSHGGRRNRRHSFDSTKKNWNKSLKVTNQLPFKLRTEQRGKLKEQMFVKRITEMLLEEEKKRIPIAQGLPWTTDEPECLVKPPIRERTEPLDIVLHSDVRAVERAAFDQYVTDRLLLVEKIKLERERKQKMEEEEEIKKLRRELVPRAQPMPYFDRPFIPKRSTKPRTVPKEPKFGSRSVETSWWASHGNVELAADD